MFTIVYVDSMRKKHVTVAKNMKELRNLKDRFKVISYDPVDKRR